jgi:hypothetical protein
MPLVDRLALRVRTQSAAYTKTKAQNQRPDPTPLRGGVSLLLRRRLFSVQEVTGTPR